MVTKGQEPYLNSMILQHEMTAIEHSLSRETKPPPAPAHHIAAGNIEQVLSKNSASHVNH